MLAGRSLAQSMVEVMVDLMWATVDQMWATVDQMEVTKGCQLTQYLFPITKHRTFEVTGFR